MLIYSFCDANYKKNIFLSFCVIIFRFHAVWPAPCRPNPATTFSFDQFNAFWSFEMIHVFILFLSYVNSSINVFYAFNF